MNFAKVVAALLSTLDAQTASDLRKLLHDSCAQRIPTLVDALREALLSGGDGAAALAALQACRDLQAAALFRDPAVIAKADAP